MFRKFLENATKRLNEKNKKKIIELDEASERVVKSREKVTEAQQRCDEAEKALDDVPLEVEKRRKDKLERIETLRKKIAELNEGK